MKALRTPWNDERVEVWISGLLRSGVLVAAAVVVVGGVIYLARHGSSNVDLKTFRGEPGNLRSVSGVARGATQLHGRAIIQLGLFLLIATPVARVAFSAIAFALEGDRLYVVVTLIVLAVLLYSLLFSS